MILYHGSYLEVPKPDLCHSRPRVDFGRGFERRISKKESDIVYKARRKSYFFRLALFIPPVIWEISVSVVSFSTKQARLMASSP